MYRVAFVKTDSTKTLTPPYTQHEKNSLEHQ